MTLAPDAELRLQLFLVAGLGSRRQLPGGRPRTVRRFVEGIEILPDLLLSAGLTEIRVFRKHVHQ